MSLLEQINNDDDDDDGDDDDEMTMMKWRQSFALADCNFNSKATVR